MKKYLLLFVFVFAAIRAWNVQQFQGSLFSVTTPSSGMYELSDFQFSNTQNPGAQIMVYADFNNDKLTDVAVLTDSLTTLNLFYWQIASSTFMPLTSISTDSPILGAQAGDFNYDGLTDLLITTQLPNSSALYTLYLQQSKGNVFGATPQAFSVTPFQHPMIFDKEGDRYIDLLVWNNNVRTVYSYDINGQTWSATPFSNYVSTSSGCSPSTTAISNYAFKNPNSNAFVDLNGDCAADLFFESTNGNQNYIEIWYRMPSLNNLFCLVDFQLITLNTSLMSFGDFDGSGSIDIMYADTPGNNQPINIHILFNQIQGSTTNPCGLTPNPSVTPYNKLRWNLQNTNDGFSNSYALPEILGTNNQLYSPDPLNRPARFRVGDINIDGYMDVLVTLQSTTNPGFGSAVLLMNTRGAQFLSYISAPYYGISLSGGGSQGLNSFPVLYASFFDFDELGNLGIWIQQPKTSTSSSNAIGIFNFVSSENFFLKANILNGFSPQGGTNIYLSLGGIYYGPSIECVVTTVGGTPVLEKGVQLPQSGYNPIDLIYIYIGLGRTNNYVEDLSVGVTASYNNLPQNPQQTSWTPIIPNSQLIVNPVLSTTWTLDVYVSPTKQTVLVAIVTLLILIFLGILIIIYHKREKDEDKKNQDRILHIFG